MMRELHNMTNHDRHERVFAAFAQQEEQRETDRLAAIAAQVDRRGGRGFIESETSFMTAAQVAERSRQLQEAQALPPIVLEEGAESSPMDRLARYR